MQPVFNDFNSTHGSLKQLNKLTFLFNPIKSKEKVNIDGPKLMVGFVLSSVNRSHNINSDNNNDLIPTINANCSIVVKAIKDSMRKSTNQIIIDNHINNNINKVE